MAYDEALAERVREMVADRPGVSEQKMFGGLGFLVHGSMAIAASSQGGVLVRVDPAESDAIVEGLRKDDLSATQLGKWGPGFNAGVDRMRRLVCEYYDGFSFGKFVRNFPHLKNTVTDLLIGDLFTERVDAVWKPMESLYEEGKDKIPTWKDGTPPENMSTKANELFLPDGRRP